MAREQVAHQRSQVANGELGSRIWSELRQGPLGCDNPRRWRQWLTRVRAAVCPLAWAFSSVVLYLTLSIIITLAAGWACPVSSFHFYCPVTFYLQASAITWRVEPMDVIHCRPQHVGGGVVGFSDNERMDGWMDRRHKHKTGGLVASFSNLSIWLLLQFSLRDLALQNHPCQFSFLFPTRLSALVSAAYTGFDSRTDPLCCFILPPRPTRCVS